MKKILLTAAAVATTAATLCATNSTAQSAKRTVAPAAAPVTTIYKLVDDSGRVTYSNLPLKGATVVELEPLTVIPGSAPPTARGVANGAAQSAQANININTPEGSNSSQVMSASVSPTAIAPPLALIPSTALPNVDAGTQKKRDDMRRKILEDEMRAEEKLLADAVIALNAVESDRTAINLMKSAAEKGTPAAYAEARRNYDQREEKLREMQENVSSHEKNLNALKREIAAVK
jgi:hypothetical protein